MNNANLHIRIPDRTKSYLEQIAEERGMRLNQLIAYIVGDWLSRFRREKQDE